MAEFIFENSLNDEDNDNDKCPIGLDPKTITQVIRRNILNNFGDDGLSSVNNSLNVKYFSPKTRICIIRVARNYKDILHSTLTLMTNIHNTQVCIRVIRVSGTIKKIQECAISYDRQLMVQYAHNKSKKEEDNEVNEYLIRNKKDIESIEP